ncbi:E3 ubiquitin-protein ligase TRIM56 [Holothuria leucospilota]|uniref:E3 ubiquitin-protein ligase TRIM56 n=1 Tax=Holothuria leucospilota TaxID=206669 RepID=A0A9Q1BUY4_HOLLE|nr:E3 ubiquitin-protein ligase TRIM56 [Holothuria leucospilota]
MASQSPSNLDEEILLCCICGDILNEPNILGCLHCFCQKCLAELIDKALDEGKFQCPTCREEYDIPDGGIEGIKGDFLLKPLLESRKLEKDFKERQREQMCSSCEKLTTVVAICPDCEGFVCEVCLSGHKVMKTFSSHRHIVTLEDIESGKVNFNFKSMTTNLKAPKCPVHKDMILHINCQTCDKLICPVCAPIHHNNHKLEEIVSAGERIKRRVQELVEASMISEKNLEKKMGEVRKISQTKLNEILGTFEQLKKTAVREEKNLRRAEQESLKQLAEMKRMIKKETDDNINIIREREACLAEEVKMLEKFCTQTIKKTEGVVKEKMNKLRNTQAKAKILTKDVDNWSVLLAAPDL